MTNFDYGFFSEGDYAIVNTKVDGALRGMIGLVDQIFSAENGDQYIKLVMPFSDPNGVFARRSIKIWGKYIIRIPDQISNCINIKEHNTAILFPSNAEPEWKLKNRYIHSASVEDLEHELRRRGTFQDLRVNKIIFNDPATIVFWNDKTKTVVKTSEGQQFSEYFGYLAALGKKIYGTNGTISRLIRDNREYGDQHETKMVKKAVEEIKEELYSNNLTRSTMNLEIKPEFKYEASCIYVNYMERQKAIDLLHFVESAIKADKHFTLQRLHEYTDEYCQAPEIDSIFGWDSMQGISVEHVGPFKWRVKFPTAKFLPDLLHLD